MKTKHEKQKKHENKKPWQKNHVYQRCRFRLTIQRTRTSQLIIAEMAHLYYRYYCIFHQFLATRITTSNLLRQRVYYLRFRTHNRTLTQADKSKGCMDRFLPQMPFLVALSYLAMSQAIRWTCSTGSPPTEDPLLDLVWRSLLGLAPAYLQDLCYEFWTLNNKPSALAGGEVPKVHWVIAPYALMSRACLLSTFPCTPTKQKK